VLLALLLLLLLGVRGCGPRAGGLVTIHQSYTKICSETSWGDRFVQTEG
jgi:hypothetical protein